MSDTPTPETDEINLLLKSLERLAEAQDGWNKALDERDEARRELVIQRYELMRLQNQLIETQIKLRERLAAVTHPNKSDQKEEA